MVDVDAAALTDRLRTRFAAAQGRVAELPDTVRSAAQRLVEKVRVALDLPSRSELIELSAKLEELDRRIADLASARVAELARPVPSLPAPADDAVETAAVDVRPVTESAIEAEADAEPAIEAAAEPAIEAAAEPAIEAAGEPAIEAAGEPAIEAAGETAETTDDAEPAVEAGAAAKEPGGRRRKNGKRATANKTSRR
jgi:hypothetical protein